MSLFVCCRLLAHHNVPPILQEVLDWFSERKLHAYSISAGQSLLYNDIFPKHKERLGKKMSELVVSDCRLGVCLASSLQVQS
jgi:hypothetical protein